MSKVVTLLSGGIDSTVVLYHLLHRGFDVLALSFDYGQRHVVELQAASKIARQADVEHRIIDLRTVGLALATANSALVNPSVVVPQGSYTDPAMKATVVPNRNAIMLSIAYGIAIANNADAIAFGPNADDYMNYPDCRPSFINAFDQAMRQATPSADINLMTPLLGDDKKRIIERGAVLGVPWHLTWSCYNGGERHCGRCSACVERIEAFSVSNVYDPTDYIDPTYWREVTSI